MNFEHERTLESLSVGDVMVTNIHSNGWGGIRIELLEEEVFDHNSRQLVKYMSSVLSQEDAIRLRDNLNKQFPLDKV